MKSLNDQQILLEQFKKTPIVQVACEKTGIGRSTYYRWRKNQNFKKQAEKALLHGTLLVNDLAESQLISAIKDKNITAIIFWLKNNNPKYSEKKINLSKTEILELVDSAVSTNPEHALKLLTQKLAESKIPNFFVNTLTSIIMKSIKIDQFKSKTKKNYLLNKLKWM